MDTTTSVKSFQAIKNQILGRLSQSEDLQSLHNHMVDELKDLERAVLGYDYPSREEKEALIGIDRGIKAANEAAAGNTEPIDSL